MTVPTLSSGLRLQHEKQVHRFDTKPLAAIAQLGERQTEDLKVPGSIPGLGTFGEASLVVSWVIF